MTREELEETVASTICCHTQMSPAVQWEIDLLMGAIDKHVTHILNERDQYASAIRQLILQVKQTAYVWSQTLPETIPTAEVVKALGLLAPRPLPEGLRDDLWQRIVGAYYLRFENDGHPEDSKAAADEAMAVVRPELESRDAEIGRLREELRKAKRAADLLAADHRAVERVQRRLDAWEQRLPENVRKDTVIEVLRADLDAA